MFSFVGVLVFCVYAFRLSDSWFMMVCCSSCQCFCVYVLFVIVGVSCAPCPVYLWHTSGVLPVMVLMYVCCVLCLSVLCCLCMCCLFCWLASVWFSGFLVFGCGFFRVYGCVVLCFMCVCWCLASVC